MSPDSPHPSQAPPPDSTPEQVVGRAIQDLTAARLGRGFIPLGILALVGVGELALAGLARPGGWVLMVGAPLAGVAMLAYGLRGVQRAFGRPERPWMALAGAGSLLPLLFGLYVVGWRGLREMARGGWAPVVGGLALTLLGGWVLRAWVRVLEVQRLAETMSGIGAAAAGPTAEWEA